jgi:hypothetical protein
MALSINNEKAYIKKPFHVPFGGLVERGSIATNVKGVNFISNRRN